MERGARRIWNQRSRKQLAVEKNKDNKIQDTRWHGFLKCSAANQIYRGLNKSNPRILIINKMKNPFIDNQYLIKLKFAIL